MVRKLFYLGLVYLVVGLSCDVVAWRLTYWEISTQRATLLIVASTVFLFWSGLAITAAFLVPSISRLNSTVCGKCDYDLRGQLQEVKCPECGNPYLEKEKGGNFDSA